MPPLLFLGVEGGATRTTGVITDADLRVLVRRVGEPTNVHAVGEKAAWQAVSDLLDDLRGPEGCDTTAPDAAAFCIAGVRSEADRRVWRRFVRKMRLGCRAVVTHDAAAGLAAGSPDETGILVICGTGALVYGRRADGAERFVGGRGPILGDEGSGFDIGLRGLRAAIRASDGRGKPTLLEHLIPERLKLKNLDALVPWVSPFAKDRVANVAPIIFEAAAAGDDVAVDIVEGAAEELARSVAVVARDLWPPPARLERVVLTGGVLRNQPSMRLALIAAVSESFPDAACALPEVEGAVGAARIARRWIEQQRQVRVRP